MKLLVVTLFVVACGMPQSHDGGVRNVPSSLTKYGKKIAYHAQRVANVTRLEGVNKNAKEMRDVLTKAREEIVASIDQLDDKDEILRANAAYQKWAVHLKQELAYRTPDGELDLKVNLSRAKDKQAVELVLRNLQAIDTMLSASPAEEAGLIARPYGHALEQAIENADKDIVRLLIDQG